MTQQQKFTEVLEHFLELRERQKYSVMYNDRMFEAKAKELDDLRGQLDAIVQPGVALQLSYGSKTHTEDIDYSATAKPVMQYFYEDPHCNVPNCTCWHDEGTGKYKNERFSPASTFAWREKPAQADDAEVRVEEPAPKADKLSREEIERLTNRVNSGLESPLIISKIRTVMLPRELPELTEEEARYIGSVCIRDFDDGMATCKVISLHEVRQIYSRIVEKFGV